MHALFRNRTSPRAAHRGPGRPGATPRRRRGAGAVLVAVCLIAVATLGTACGSSSTGRSTSTLAKKDSVSFRGLPQFEGSTPVGQPDVQGSATTQTFTVNNASPHEILQFYAESLGDWTVLEEPHALGSGAQSAWRGRWRGGTATLLVSAAHTPSPNQKATQYSLDLRDS